MLAHETLAVPRRGAAPTSLMRRKSVGVAQAPQANVPVRTKASNQRFILRHMTGETLDEIEDLARSDAGEPVSGADVASGFAA